MTSEQSYSWLDRLLHRLAFCSQVVQMTAADIEDLLYGKRFRTLTIDRPIFVTSLPRAGTTLILEVLGRFGGLATHCYRDMPFILAPLLWHRLSRSFRKPADLRERAHGDGMKVGYDSPEAFEEVLWRAFWPEKFTKDRIALWSEHEDAAEFRECFRSHIQRIIAVRSTGAPGQRRYISKNNGNIARIGFLRRLFPDALILIPFRSPIDQAGSLLRQHLRFSEIHRQDPFAKRYMEDIGHLEFGMLHRRICFTGAVETDRPYRPEALDYWILYWMEAFGHILCHKDVVVLISYERLCHGGSAALRAVAERLSIPNEELHEPPGAALTPPRSYPADSTANQDLLERAHAVHRELLALSIV